MYIETVSDFRAAIRQGPYAWPGGYPVFYVCSDGGVLCPDCAYKERGNVIRAIHDHDSSGWRVVGCDVYYGPDVDPSDPNYSPTVCDHCSLDFDSV